MKLKDRVILLTGAAGGLGSAIAKSAVEAGARLALLDRNEEALNQIAADLPDAEIFFRAVDLGDNDALRSFVEATITTLGGLDIVIHAVGGFSMGTPVHDTPEENWKKMFELNLWSSVTLAEACVPTLKQSDSGRLIYVAARAAQQGLPNMGAYCASKGALTRLVESMSAELLEDKVTVNCVLPSVIDTAPNRQAMPDVDPETWVSPASLAEVILFLASDAARDISGAAIPVYGRC